MLRATSSAIVLQRFWPFPRAIPQRQLRRRAPSHSARALHFFCRLQPMARHLEHHVLVLLALCAGCPAKALRGKIAVFLWWTESWTHWSYTYALMSRFSESWDKTAPAAHEPAIGDRPETRCGKPLGQNPRRM